MRHFLFNETLPVQRDTVAGPNVRDSIIKVKYYPVMKERYHYTKHYHKHYENRSIIIL